MGDIEVFLTKEYKGTLESLEELIKDLQVDPYDYSFDVIKKTVFLHKLGIRYQPGDNYVVKVSESFPSIG